MTKTIRHSQCFTVGDWTVDVQRNQIRCASTTNSLEPRIMDLLVLLSKNAGTTMPRDELLQTIWGGTHYSDSTLARAISILRQNLGDKPEKPAYIETIPKRGYRLKAEVSFAPADHSKPIPQINISKIKRGRNITIALLLVMMVWAVMYRVTQQPPGTTTTPTGRLALLPLNVVSGTDDQAIALAFQESIARNLSLSTSLKISSYHRVPEKQLIENVDYILRGSLVSNAETIELHLILWDVNAKTPLQDTTFQGSITQLPDMQREVYLGIVAMLNTNLSTQSVQAPTPTNDAAYLAYVKARWHWRQRDQQHLILAQRLFEEALAAEPDFAAAHAGLALTWLTMSNYQILDASSAYSLAQQAVDTALSIDPKTPDGHLAQAQLWFQRDWDFTKAMSALDTALLYQPTLVDARQVKAEILAITGQFDAAIAQIDQAVLQRPYDALLVGVRGMVYLHAGRYEQADDIMTELELLRPAFFWHYRYWAYIRTYLNDPVGAFRVRLHKFARILPDTAYQELRKITSNVHDEAFWNWQVSRLIAQYPDPFATSSTLLAEAYAALGDHENAGIWLKRSIAFRGEAYPLVRVSPWLQLINQDPQIQQTIAGFDFADLNHKARF